jgi:orotate phosphoribosyltransferase
MSNTTARELLGINPALAPEALDRIREIVDRTEALRRGHFALRGALHTEVALRFRAIGRDAEGCTELARLLVALSSWSWEGVRVLSPGSAGFFLGRAISLAKGAPHSVLHMDGRRQPTSQLTTGALRAGDRVVLVNDVGRLEDSLEPMRALVEQRGASVVGALLFTAFDLGTLESYCNAKRISCHYLTSKRWDAFPPGMSCPGCRDKKGLVPVADFS